MIELAGVGKDFGTRRQPVRALHDVALSLDPGVWAVVGPNGAGKSTLLALVLGFLMPSSGTVTIDGLSPRRYRRRVGVGYLPERFRLPPQWPVRDALHGLAGLEGLDATAAADRVDWVMDHLGLADHADRQVGELSRGLNQRMGLAQALLGDRRLLVLDEPTEGLDPLWRVRFRDLLMDLRGDGRTVLLASHELAEVERVADRVILLDGGRLKEVLDAKGPAGPVTRYRIDTDAPADILAIAFPDADPGRRPVVVTVTDPADLSHRLGALLDAGGIVRSVMPEADLEARVRHRLEEA
jgi:ABC-2 type transport system ATP-binding protein